MFVDTDLAIKALLNRTYKLHMYFRELSITLSYLHQTED